MAGMTTPALAVLGTVNRVRSTVSAIDRLTGGPTRRRRAEREQEEARDRALLEETQASRLAELRDRHRLEAEEAGDRRRERAGLIRAEAEEAARERKAALRRSVSRLRAQLGSQGLSSADGSGEAILLGLVREAAEEDAAAGCRRCAAKALDDEAMAAWRRNLLEVTRLQERQRLERLAQGYG